MRFIIKRPTAQFISQLTQKNRFTGQKRFFFEFLSTKKNAVESASSPVSANKHNNNIELLSQIWTTNSVASGQECGVSKSFSTELLNALKELEKEQSSDSNVSTNNLAFKAFSIVSKKEPALYKEAQKIGLPRAMIINGLVNELLSVSESEKLGVRGSIAALLDHLRLLKCEPTGLGLIDFHAMFKLVNQRVKIDYPISLSLTQSLVSVFPISYSGKPSVEESLLYSLKMLLANDMIKPIEDFIQRELLSPNELKINSCYLPSLHLLFTQHFIPKIRLVPHITNENILRDLTFILERIMNQSEFKTFAAQKAVLALEKILTSKEEKSFPDLFNRLVHISMIKVKPELLAKCIRHLCHWNDKFSHARKLLETLEEKYPEHASTLSSNLNTAYFVARFEIYGTKRKGSSVKLCMEKVDETEKMLKSNPNFESIDSEILKHWVKAEKALGNHAKLSELYVKTQKLHWGPQAAKEMAEYLIVAGNIDLSRFYNFLKNGKIFLTDEDLTTGFIWRACERGKFLLLEDLLLSVPQKSKNLTLVTAEAVEKIILTIRSRSDFPEQVKASWGVHPTRDQLLKYIDLIRDGKSAERRQMLDSIPLLEYFLWMQYYRYRFGKIPRRLQNQLKKPFGRPERGNPYESLANYVKLVSIGKFHKQDDLFEWFQ